MANIVFAGPEAAPIRSCFETAAVNRCRLHADVVGSGLSQELLNDHLRLVVCALAKILMPDTSLRIDKVQSRPIVVPERLPDDMLVVDRDRVIDPHVPDGGANVAWIFFKRELRRMHADHHQTLVFVFLGPGAHVRQRAQPVDASVGPEIEKHDFPA